MKKYSKYKKEILENLVKNSCSISQVMEKLNLVPRGSNYSRFKKMIKDLEIDTLHFNKIGNIRNFNHHSKESFIMDVLKLNGKNWNSFSIKNKLITYNLIENKCLDCRQDSVWNKKELKLQLDHINGDHRDNRLSNLRLLCPNCHSQTETYCGKNKN